MEQALDVALSEAVQGVDAVLVVVDATRVLKDERALDAVRAELTQKNVEQIDFVALNKIDLLNRDDIFRALERVNTTLCGDTVKGEIVPTSALKGEGIDTLVRCVEKILPEGPKFFEPGTTSDQSEKQLVTEVIREKIFRLLRDEIPYSSAVIIDGWEESPERLSIHASIIVERSSQKPIVVGKGGAMIKEIGIAARRELETILKTAIMLKLFVRVEKDWSLTARGVEKFGLPS
jgi:GTP-binding protein Era